MVAAELRRRTRRLSIIIVAGMLSAAFGGKFGIDDDTETPNTLTAGFSYGDEQVVIEVRGRMTNGEGTRQARVVTAGLVKAFGRNEPQRHRGHREDKKEQESLCELEGAARLPFFRVVLSVSSVSLWFISSAPC